MPQKLTVLIPCKNEAGNIRACIESVRGVADEIGVERRELILRVDGCATDADAADVDHHGGRAGRSLGRRQRDGWSAGLGAWRRGFQKSFSLSAGLFARRDAEFPIRG